MQKKLIVLQEGSKDCGVACLLSIIRYYGGDISLERLINLTRTDKDGTNFYSLSKVAKEIGLISSSYKVEEESQIKEINTPFISQINNKNYMHFVVVYKIDETKITIMDPSRGKVVMDLFDYFNIWTGNIMIFEKEKALPIDKEEKVLNKTIIRVLLKNKSSILFIIVLSLIFTIFSVLTSFYSQIVFDKVIDTTINNLKIITISFSVLLIIKEITYYIRNYLIIYLNQKFDVSIILSTFTKVILLPFYYYKNKTTGEVLSRINDLFSIKNFISQIIVTIILDSITYIISFIIMYSINFKLLIVSLAISFIYCFIIICFNYPIKKYTKSVQVNNALVNHRIIESVSAYETIKNLNIEDNIILKFSYDYTRLLKENYIKENINNTMLFVKNLITSIGLLLINYLTVRQIADNNLTIGSYMTINILSNYLIYPINNLMNLLAEYHYIKNSVVRANNLLTVGEEELTNTRLKVIGNIKISNLTYSYNNKKNILDNISFYIKEKDRVVILGESGTGKSTIMKLIYKYYDVSRNMISINNFDINDYSLLDIRKNIAYISQNERIFTSSIRDNIILNRNIPEEEFLKVCKLTYVDEIIKDNILGYDYMLEEDGINISGGQRQRIILARGILKNSNIVMIDEGLNEIDINLERKILTNIFNNYVEKTFIIISHRKSNLDLYNRMITIHKNIANNYERRTNEVLCR